MSVCTVEDCNLNAYENNSKCILHCEKHEYSGDFRKIGFLNTFYTQLAENIVNQVFDNREEVGSAVGGVYHQITQENFLNDLKSNEPDLQYSDVIEDGQVFVFYGMFFPERKGRDRFDYVRLLNKLPKIHFNYCEFTIKYLDLDKTKCFFQDCKFHNGLLLYNLNILENESDVLFQMCEFDDKVTSFSEEVKTTIENSLFSDCSFTKLEFENTIFQKPIFKNHITSDNNMEELSFHNSIIESSLKLDYYQIEHIYFINTVLNNELEAYKLNTEDFLVKGSTFKGLVNFYNCNFETIVIYKSKFEEMVGFQYSNFTDESKFENVTFLSFINMQNTNFLNGLDMSEAYLKEYPNFLGANIDAEHTNKETFRIIKHSFDKIGNTSEANKYFSYEMAKDMKETLLLKNPAKKIMLIFNRLLSNFGQWYVLPLLWIILLLPLHEWVVNSNMFDDLNVLNSIVKNISPLERFLDKDMEFISLLFYIAYSVLIYHFIIAVKRITKR